MVVAFAISAASAQKRSGFAIYPYVNYQASDIPASASRTLEKKLLSLVTANGLAATESDFVITAIADIVEENVTNTAPAMTVAKVEIEIYLLRRFMENARKKLEEYYAEKQQMVDSVAVAVEPAWFFEENIK